MAKQTNEFKPRTDSKAKWKDVNRVDRPRFEQSHPWHFTFENSDKEAYSRGYDAIDWSHKWDSE